ncbi:MAG: restriction endonuclease subunit S [Caldilineaceae bacterium]
MDMTDNESLIETTLGMRPADWQVVPLEELGTKFHGGGTPSTKKPEYWDGNIPWTTSVYIDEKLFLNQCAGYITQLGLDNCSSQLVPKGNLLIGTRVGVGKVAINQFDTAISQDLTALIVDQKKVDPVYLVYAIRTEATQRTILSATRGTTIKGIPRADLIKVQIALPPLSEQRRIAAVLNAIQEAVAAQEDVIAAARAFKRSLMARLFTYGPGRTPAVTKETAIGEVPAHWEVVGLKDVAVIGNGSTPKRTNPQYWTEGTIPWLTSTRIHDQFIGHADELVTILARQECHLPMVPKDSILVAITGQGKTLGNAALTTFETTINQHLAYITIQRQDVIPEFVLRYLQYRYEDLRQAGQAGGSTKAALTCGLLKLYPLPLPSSEEQRSIAEIVRAADEKIAAEEDRKAALQSLFQSMLHQLMTGQVRLVGGDGAFPEGAADRSVD